MKDLPENAKMFFSERFEKVIYKEDFIFVKRLEDDITLRNFVYQRLDIVLKDWQNWERFLTLVVDCAGLMQPEKTKEARALRKKAEDLQKDIATYCEKLVNTIYELDNIGEQGFIDTPYCGSPVDVIVEAGKNHILFDWYIKENLQTAVAGYGLKYLPSIIDLIKQIGLVYSEQKIEFEHNYMLLNQRASHRDFCVKLSSCIDEHIRAKALPEKFKLTYSDMADFCNALLPSDKTITADNVKTYINDLKKTQQREVSEA